MRIGKVWKGIEGFKKKDYKKSGHPKSKNMILIIGWREKKSYLSSLECKVTTLLKQDN